MSMAIHQPVKAIKLRLDLDFSPMMLQTFSEIATHMMIVASVIEAPPLSTEMLRHAK